MSSIDTFRFDICGRPQAERLLAAGAITHLVSFRDVGAAPLRSAAAVADRIELEFDDASSPDSAMFGYRPPQPEDMQLLVHWFQERQAALRTGTVLFQCEQGISRSPAAAMIALCVLGASRESASRSVLRKQPRAVPNPLMLALAQPWLGN
jgi:predicted protein tyrosine phosphatase